MHERDPSFIGINYAAVISFDGTHNKPNINKIKIIFIFLNQIIIIIIIDFLLLGLNYFFYTHEVKIIKTLFKFIFPKKLFNIKY